MPSAMLTHSKTALRAGLPETRVSEGVCFMHKIAFRQYRGQLLAAIRIAIVLWGEGGHYLEEIWDRTLSELERRFELLEG